MKKIEKIENLLRFTLTKDIGNITVNKLLKYFGTSDNILGASEEQLRDVKGLRSNQIRAVLNAKDVDVRTELDAAAQQNINIISYDDPSYPQSLRYSDDPPYLLYIKGELKPQDIKSIGVVGTRHASRYGREQAEIFGRDLAAAGITVISGLARGVDTYAHKGALSAGGRTVAVVGCGFNHVYPPENRDLLTEIASTAAVVSEFAMDVSPNRNTFPRRNRIIAGMSLGTLVVEAPLRSGALITARQALEMGRDIFAVPGMVDMQQCGGCLKLIREGAVLVRNVEDVINEIKVKDEFKENSFNEKIQHTIIQKMEEQQEIIESVDEKIMQALGNEVLHVDELCYELDINVGDLSSALMILELRNMVKSEPGGFYKKL